MKALLEKIQPELITLDPTELGRVDRATFEQRHRDRVEALVSCFYKSLLVDFLGASLKTNYSTTGVECAVL